MVCKNCGFKYEQGGDGRHNCSDVLKDKIDQLKIAIQNIIAEGKEAVKKS